VIERTTKRISPAPINRLPSELLLKIFTLGHYDVTSRHELVESAIKYSHVSKYWRSVALACHSLWSHLSTHFSPQFIDTLFIRSRPLPLSVYIPWETREGSARQILQHLSYIQELALDEGLDDLHMLLDRPAPLLQRLSVRQEPEYHVILEDRLFGGVAPCLEEVSLSACVIPWHSGLLRRLTSLAVALPLESGRPTLCELKTVLRACPTLCSLKLKNASPDFLGVDSPLPGSDEVVHLPHMVSLVLSDQNHDFPKLVQHMHIPSHAELRLEPRRTEIWPLRSVTALTLEEHSRAQRQDDLRIHSLRISSFSHRIRIDAMQLASDLTVRAQSGKQFLWQLLVTFKYREFNNDHLLLDVLGGIPLSDVSLLHLCEEGMARSYTVLTILALMPQLNALTLPDTMLGGLYGISEPTEIIEMEPLPSCAHLKSVIVDVVCSIDEVDTDLLASWLRQRNQRGLRLTRLAFKIDTPEYPETKVKRGKLQKKIAPHVDSFTWIRKVRRKLSP
jgi:hypothetical protein